MVAETSSSMPLLQKNQSDTPYLENRSSDFHYLGTKIHLSKRLKQIAHIYVNPMHLKFWCAIPNLSFTGLVYPFITGELFIALLGNHPYLFIWWDQINQVLCQALSNIKFLVIFFKLSESFVLLKIYQYKICGSEDTDNFIKYITKWYKRIAYNNWNVPKINIPDIQVIPS